MRIGKSFTFEAAHRLQRHDGKCRNLHGHSYRVEVEVEGANINSEGPKSGMLMDFTDLSGWWRPLEHVFDHVVILEEEDPLVEALNAQTTVTSFPFPPTAENLATWIGTDLRNFLATVVFPLARNEQFSVTCRVYETAKSYAEVWLDRDPNQG